MNIANRIVTVVVTYNGEPWIERLLGSLADATPAGAVIVVDNASTDGTCSIVAARFPAVELVRLERNVGFGRGNNVGIRRAIDRGAEMVFLINQDAYVLPETVAALASFLDTHPEFQVVSPLHCSPDLSAVDQRTMRGYLVRYAPEYLSDACLGLTREYYPMGGVNAAAWMVRTRAFMAAGGFDPLFFMYGEDDDLLARFRRLGQRFALLPGGRIVHIRASAAPAETGRIRRIWRLSERVRSGLIAEIKVGPSSYLGGLLLLVVEGTIFPFGRLLVQRDLSMFVAHLVAVLRVVRVYPRIRRSIAQCAHPGPHFLVDHPDGR